MNKDELERENKLLKKKIGRFKDIDLKFISKGGRVKMISWGEDYKEWTLEKRLEYAEALASAMNDACDLIQKERNQYLKEKLELQAALLECDKNLSTQRLNNINSITKSNADKQELIKALREAEETLKQWQ